MGQHGWALSGESGEQFNPDARGRQTGERRVGGRIVYKKRYARASSGVAGVREQELGVPSFLQVRRDMLL
ncbi:hypothetical protein UB43_11440 [Pseudomonas sp. 21]|nr:hypothetical protein UB43_11440 [Pseudomonas sp. 21]